MKFLKSLSIFAKDLMKMSRIDEIKKMLKTDNNDSFLTYALALEYEKIEDRKQAIEIIEELLRALAVSGDTETANVLIR